MHLERIAGAYWRLRRLRRFETNILSNALADNLADQISEARDMALTFAAAETYGMPPWDLDPEDSRPAPPSDPEALGEAANSTWGRIIDAHLLRIRMALTEVGPSELSMLRVFGKDATVDSVLEKLLRYERFLETSAQRSLRELREAQERRQREVWPVVEGGSGATASRARRT